MKHAEYQLPQDENEAPDLEEVQEAWQQELQNEVKEVKEEIDDTMEAGGN